MKTRKSEAGFALREPASFGVDYRLYCRLRQASG